MFRFFSVFFAFVVWASSADAGNIRYGYNSLGEYVPVEIDLSSFLQFEVLGRYPQYHETVTSVRDGIIAENIEQVVSRIHLQRDIAGPGGTQYVAEGFVYLDLDIRIGIDRRVHPHDYIRLLLHSTRLLHDIVRSERIHELDYVSIGSVRR